MRASAKILLISLFTLIGKFPVFAQNIDYQFNPFIRSIPNIYDLAIQPDGKIIIGGDIATVGNHSTSSLVRLHPSGALDTSFVTNTDELYAYNTSVLANGKVFSQVSFTRNYIIQLNNDGSEDEGFQLDGSIHGTTKYAVQENKYIILTGGWENDGYHGKIVRINNDGSIDSSFTPVDVKGEVYSLEVIDGGKIVVIMQINGNNTIVRLHKNGELDETFNPGVFDGEYLQIRSVKWQADGKIIISGFFTTYNGTETGGFIRLNADGSLDNSFVIPGPTGNIFDYGVKAMLVLPSGKILVTGNKYDYYEGGFNVLARLNQDGSLDTSFTPKKMSIHNEAIYDYSKIAAYENTIYLVGAFTTYENEERYGLVAIDADGNLIDSFNPKLGGSSSIKTALLQPDGKIVIAGNFVEINNISTKGIARLMKDGSLDTLFKDNIGSGPDRAVSSLALQDNDKILVGGSFNNFNNKEQFFLVRLNQDGTPDTTFITNINFTYLSNGVDHILLDSNKIYIGGNLVYNNGSERNRVVRLLQDGTVDNTFAPDQPSGDFMLSSMAMHDTGILISGKIWDSTGFTKGYFLKLNSDGSIDSAFQKNLMQDYSIYNINTLSDDMILCGGEILTGHGDNNPNPLFQISRQGKIFDQYSISSNGFGTFRDIQPISDTTFIVGGNFSSINGFSRSDLAKIDLKGRVYGGFRADMSGNVQQILREDENHILVFGKFYKINNVSGFSGITRINIYAPRAPMDISVNLDEARGVEVSWKDSADAVTGYKIYRSSSNGAGLTLIDSVGAGVTTYLDTDIESGFTYSYQVVTYNNDFQSEFPEPVSVSTAQLNVPQTPIGLALDYNNGAVYLTWAGGNANVSGYVVERSDGKEFVPLDTISANSFYDQAIEINIEYQYRVKAFNVIGESDYSSIVSYINQVTGIDLGQMQKDNLPYPNPSENVFILKTGQPIAYENIRLINSEGKALTFSHVTQQEWGQLKIDLSGEVNGIYLLIIKSGQKVTSYRLIKDKLTR